MATTLHNLALATLCFVAKSICYKVKNIFLFNVEHDFIFLILTIKCKYIDTNTIFVKKITVHCNANSEQIDFNR